MKSEDFSGYDLENIRFTLPNYVERDLKEF